MTKSNAIGSEPWAPAAEVSEHLGVAKNTIYRWIESSNLSAHYRGRFWFKPAKVAARVGHRGVDDDCAAYPSKRERT